MADDDRLNLRELEPVKPKSGTLSAVVHRSLSWLQPLPPIRFIGAVWGIVRRIKPMTWVKSILTFVAVEGIKLGLPFVIAHGLRLIGAVTSGFLDKAGFHTIANLDRIIFFGAANAVKWAGGVILTKGAFVLIPAIAVELGLAVGNEYVSDNYRKAVIVACKPIKVKQPRKAGQLREVTVADGFAASECGAKPGLLERIGLAHDRQLGRTKPYENYFRVTAHFYCQPENGGKMVVREREFLINATLAKRHGLDKIVPGQSSQITADFVTYGQNLTLPFLGKMTPRIHEIKNLRNLDATEQSAVAACSHQHKINKKDVWRPFGWINTVIPVMKP